MSASSFTTSIALLALCLLSSTATAQEPDLPIREWPADVFEDLQLIRQISTAFTFSINVDDPAVLAAEFPGRELAEFDRDRNGRFLGMEGDREAALGLADRDLAEAQFIHDIVDADEDGLLGFYELECIFAARHYGVPDLDVLRLDPQSSATYGGVPDGERDCDGDGMPNLWELNNGFDPLRAEDGAEDADDDGVPNTDEYDDGTDPRSPDSDGDGVPDGEERGPDGGRDSDGDGVDDGLDPDSDGDGIGDGVDNCRIVANPDQRDVDGDGSGDACDADSDQDGVPDVDDNCPELANETQQDTDGDGQGDACDDDDDDDGVPDLADVCPRVPDPAQIDTDIDGLGDLCDDDADNDGTPNVADNCPLISNPAQGDIDSDGLGEPCDPDDDGDGVPDVDDNCPARANPDQADADGDGVGDRCSLDGDGDGRGDATDNCPMTPNADQSDLDGDGLGDACDDDTDGDGRRNGQDNCLLVPNPVQTDTDGDGLGDLCDDDADDDGVDNLDDLCPLEPDPFQGDIDGDGVGDVCDGDRDDDGVIDPLDNCPEVANARQTDLDGDGFGDACDADPGDPDVCDLDEDGDEIPIPIDNCPAVANPDQADANGDGIGDACDPDPDGDGMPREFDNCPLVDNPYQLDTDGDGIGDACDDDDDGDGLPDADDNCPVDINPGQSDFDGDGIGDACDTDGDRDGIPDINDNCPVDANADQQDVDGDGFGDACDDDDDGDGKTDADDNCPLVINPDQADSDGDGIGDACEGDRDGDDIPDADDNCPDHANADQADADADGLGDLCDPDRDGDDIPNGDDVCVDVPNPDQSDLDGDQLGDACDPDRDGDWMEDPFDNCPDVPNPDQSDADFDGIGDACEPDDTDGDEIDDPDDVCPDIPDPDQADRDGDGVGDACDLCPDQADAQQLDGDLDGIGDACDNCVAFNPDQIDSDGDGIGDTCEAIDPDGDRRTDDDNCPFVANPLQADADSDGLGDVCDNCPLQANPDQFDGNLDGVGDACDEDDDGIEDDGDNCRALANRLQADGDGDGIGDRCDVCPGVADPGQVDSNGDGIGDVCDADDDGLPDPEDNCRLVANAEQFDQDGDGVGDACDNCLLTANADQADFDADGLGDACDGDGDRVLDRDDNCPDAENADQSDGDGDGIGDACDVCPEAIDPLQADTDADGWGDLCDNCRLANPDQADSDGDGYGDACEDVDQDEDGPFDAEDNCPLLANADQADFDGDGVGDVCDLCVDVADPEQTDTDGDGVGDACDNCRLPNPEQADRDGDGYGDVCAAGDRDTDDVPDEEDNCPDVSNPDQIDSDGDGDGDACDLCPLIAEAVQADRDRDGIGDLCDNCPHVLNAAQTDADGDGVGNPCDNCIIANADQLDLDGNGRGDICDEQDPDADDVIDDDNCPEVENPAQFDFDEDGLGDACDNCVLVDNVEQADRDGDGIGDACDPAPDDPTNGDEPRRPEVCDGVDNELDGQVDNIRLRRNLGLANRFAVEVYDANYRGLTYLTSLAQSVGADRMEVGADLTPLAALSYLEAPLLPGGSPRGYLGLSQEERMLVWRLVRGAMQRDAACMRRGPVESYRTGSLAMLLSAWLRSGGPDDVGLELSVTECLTNAVDVMLAYQGHFADTYPAVSPLEDPQPEVCDAVDNDCDGREDEGLAGCQPGVLNPRGNQLGANCGPPEIYRGGWHYRTVRPVTDMSTTIFVVSGLVAADEFVPGAVNDDMRRRLLNQLEWSTHPEGLSWAGSSMYNSSDVPGVSGRQVSDQFENGNVAMTAVSLWGYRTLGVPCSDPRPQSHMRYLRSRYNPDGNIGRSYWYALWASEKALYSCTDDGGDGLVREDFGTRNPAVDGYPYQQPGHSYDYARALLGKQNAASGQFRSNNAFQWRADSAHVFALLTLASSLGGIVTEEIEHRNDTEPECSDGIDNDGDGFIDREDPDCPFACSLFERGLPACGDGLDNDGDGLADFPLDPGCKHPLEEDETNTACADGIDNDGNGLVDMDDPGCESAYDEEETPLLDPDAPWAPAVADAIWSPENNLPEVIEIEQFDEVRFGHAFDGFQAAFVSTGLDGAANGDAFETAMLEANETERVVFPEVGRFPYFVRADNGNGQLFELAGFEVRVSPPSGPRPWTMPQCGNGQDDDGDGSIDFPDDPECVSTHQATEDLACLANPNRGAVREIPGVGLHLGDTADRDDIHTGPCSADGAGDELWVLHLDRPALVQMRTAGADTTLTLRADCSEVLRCDDDEVPGVATSAIDARLEAGSYFVVAETRGETTEYTLEVSIDVLPDAQCRNGIDDDGDGRIDAPDDPGCSSLDDDSEGPRDLSPRCADGVDNDGDGAVDLADMGCEDREDDDESNPGDTVTQCADGIDNDFDGLVDYPADNDCLSAATEVEGPYCREEVDVVSLDGIGRVVGILAEDDPDDYAFVCAEAGSPDHVYSVTAHRPGTLRASLDNPGTAIRGAVELRANCERPDDDVSCGPAVPTESMVSHLRVDNPGTYFAVVSGGAPDIHFRSRRLPIDVDDADCSLRDTARFFGYAFEDDATPDTSDVGEGCGAFEFAGYTYLDLSYDDGPYVEVPANGQHDLHFEARRLSVDAGLVGDDIWRLVVEDIGGEFFWLGSGRHSLGHDLEDQTFRGSVNVGGATIPYLVRNDNGLDVFLPGAIPQVFFMVVPYVAHEIGDMYLSSSRGNRIDMYADRLSDGFIVYLAAADIPAAEVAARVVADLDFEVDPRPSRGAYELTLSLLPQCSDGLDNDGDGEVDDADAGCFWGPDDDETNPPVPPACANGADDDGDGVADWPADPGCGMAGDPDETDPLVPPECGDGIDNDGDGRVDYPWDPGCVTPGDATELDGPFAPECADGIENERDGLIDYPDDPQCSSAADNTESGDEVAAPQCLDGRDNDLDGRVDLADPGCQSGADGDEADPVFEPACLDNVDNDGDGFVDWPDDPGCAAAGSVCEEGGDFSPCDGICVQTRTDPANCGACGVVCLPEAECVGGVCVQ